MQLMQRVSSYIQGLCLRVWNATFNFFKTIAAQIHFAYTWLANFFTSNLSKVRWTSSKVIESFPVDDLNPFFKNSRDRDEAFRILSSVGLEQRRKILQLVDLLFTDQMSDFERKETIRVLARINDPDQIESIVGLAIELITDQMTTSRKEIIRMLTDINLGQRRRVVWAAVQLIKDGMNDAERIGILRELARINDSRLRDDVANFAQVLTEPWRQIANINQIFAQFSPEARRRVFAEAERTCVQMNDEEKIQWLEAKKEEVLKEEQNEQSLLVFYQALERLTRLSQDLRAQEEFPEIHDSPAVDVGGPRRDFVTKLMQELFEPVSGQCLLPIVRWDEGLLPTVKQNNFVAEEELIQYYKALGVVFAFIIKDDRWSITTGRYFHPVLFQTLHGLSWQDMGRDFDAIFDPLLKRYLKFQYPSIFPNDEVVNNFVNGKELPDGIESKGSFIEEYQIREILLPISCIAKSIHQHLDERSWREIQRKSAEDLDIKIQGGKVSKDGIRAVLICQNRELQGFFDRWIDECTEKQLKRFVRVATGSFSSPRRNLRVNVFGADQKRLPGYHTCTYEIDMPLYSKYDTFKTRLEWSLGADGFDYM